MSKFFEFSVRDLKGAVFDLNKLKGKSILVVNVASKCGFTSQYKGLETLYQKYKDQGLIILGFPCNQFGGQEPGGANEIQACGLTYGVQFPIMEKVDVNGANAHPLYEFLKSSKPGLLGIQMIKWNFEKFLIDKNGNVVERWASTSTPESMESTILNLLEMAPKSFESFQDALDSGCIVTEYHKHDENPNYTVHTKRADGTLHAYTNITADHLKAGLGVHNLTNSYESPDKLQNQGGVARGGKITDFHKTAKGSFAVHIQTTDGSRHSYSSVSEKVLQGVPGFNSIEENSFAMYKRFFHQTLIRHTLPASSAQLSVASSSAQLSVASSSAQLSVASSSHLQIPTLPTCHDGMVFREVAGHKEAISDSNGFSKITDPENPLKALSPQENMKMSSEWDDAILIKLRLQDWHRVFENITPKDWDSVKISQDIKDYSLNMFAKMKTLGVTPDAFIYSTLFKIFSDDWKQVQEFYRFALRTTKDVVKVSSLSTCLLNNKSYQVLLMIYNAKHTNYELKSLLLNLWDDLKAIQIKVSRETYIAFLKSKGIEKTGDFISSLHQKLKWRKIVLKEKWDLETYSALMNAYSLVGFYDVVDRLYVDMKAERIKLSRECFTSYLRVLEIKQRYKRILIIQKEMETRIDVFENKSVQILLNASLELGNIENITYLYQKCWKEHEKGSGITWRSFESIIGIYSKLGKLKECIQVYQKYKELRIKVSSEYNQKLHLSRPKVDIKESSFSRLYMLPEPPRDVLYQMAYVLGYNRDVDAAKKFFMEEVLNHERLILYHYRKQIGLSKVLKLQVNKSQTKIDNIRSHKSPQGGSLIRKYKDNITKCNKSLKKNYKNLEVGHAGPVGIVYQGLIEGWKKGLEQLDNDDLGSYYVQMDQLVNDLIDFETAA